MATEAFSILGQVSPAAATPADLYTCPASTELVASTIFVCNRSVTATEFRISVAIAGAAEADAQWLYYDVPILGNDTFATTTGITLEATDKIRVEATLATVSFNLFGTEITP